MLTESVKPIPLRRRVEIAARRISTCAILLALVLVVVWIRLLPRDLPGAVDRASQDIRDRIHVEVMRKLSGYPARSQRVPQVAALIDRWMNDHPREIAGQMDAMARRIKSDLMYTAADGQSYPFLGGFDSYLWLRLARNRLRTGNPCDAVVNGVCRDTYTDAPVGSTSLYARSLHPAAISAMHRVALRFHPDYPLPATAFWVSVIAGALAVIPAFFLGRFFGGSIGGILCALFASVHPAVLSRTMSGDNDIWDVVLPLYAMWAIFTAFREQRLFRAASYAVLASICMGLQAWAWRGWLFIYAVFVTGCLAALLLEAGRFIAHEKNRRVWQSASVRKIGVVLLTFYLASAACTAFTVSPRDYFGAPLAALATAMRASDTNPLPSGVPALAWPNVLGTVAELSRLGFRGVVQVAGGGTVLIFASIGLLVILLATFRPQSGGSGNAGVADDQAGRRAAACVLTVWAVAAVYAAFHGNRFIFLLVTPLGLALAAVGIVARAAWNAAATGSPLYRRTTRAALTVVVALILLQPLVWGFAVATEDLPQMNSAWWAALTNLREHSASDAIVHTWWDYGHWVTYAAERRVDNDGTSVLTHIPVWVGKALAAPREEDSVGLLRMLSCGSELTPFPEGGRGAYGKLLALGRVPLDAYSMLTTLAALTGQEADEYLARRGIAPAGRSNVLRSSHCTPPESYLILSSNMVERRRTWMAFGLWDPARPSARPVSDAVPFLREWKACKAEPAPAQITCDVQAEIPPRPAVVDRVVMGSGGPLQLIGRNGHVRVAGPPAVEIRAERDGLHLSEFQNTPYSNLGVLYDVANSRILIGAPEFLKSTFVHLMYLDGRYARYYEKTDDRFAADERVVTWKINWAASGPAKSLAQ